jgi:hypothetical protein
VPVTFQFGAVFVDAETVLRVFIVVVIKIIYDPLRADVLQIETAIPLAISLNTVQQSARTARTAHGLKIHGSHINITT